MGLLLIGIGVLGKLALRDYANIETVFVASLLAGSVLGRAWTVLVPVGVLGVLQALLWGTEYMGYGLEAMAGITFFVVTGYVFVGLAGRTMRRRVVLRVKSIALLTMISVPLTIAYDVWTDIGDWYFLFRPAGVDFPTVLYLQIPFTLYHILSTLVFVPLFGTSFLVLHEHLVAAPRRAVAPEPVPPADPSD
jgi:hypothetical protein